MLEVKGLSKSYGKQRALDACSFKVQKHEIIGVCGENGSGKTTLFRCLMGLCAKDAGEIRLAGKKIGEERRVDFGYLPEHRSLYTDLSVEDTLQHYARLRNMDQQRIDQRIRELIQGLDFKLPLNSKIAKLSKGNQQKVQFMAALIHDPQVVILDEPFTGLDYVNLERIQDFLLKLASQGKYILLSSHQYDELDAICNSLLILSEGKTVGYGNLDRMKNETGACTVKVNGQVPVLQHLREDEEMEMMGNAIIIKTHTPQRAKRLLNQLTREEAISDLSMERIKVKELIRLRCKK
ncbi:MAG: ATP-binding cassette domain-containing protein [Erysipelotrichales bacterium]|nr:MAG: ATP-binding cassette domain-containing protein [Erysipelotrichales bacterium]